MRTLSADLLAAQAELNRNPESEIIIRDVMIRLSNLTEASYSTGYPSATGASNIPQCQIDGDVCSYNSIWRAWVHGDNTVRITNIAVPFSPSSWTGSGVITETTDGNHRPTIDGDRIFWAYNGNVMEKTITGISTTAAATTFEGSAYTVDTDHVALAAVSNSVVYMVCLHTDTDFKYVSLHRVTQTGVVDCPHSIVVDSDYIAPSLTWFDAATLQGRDIIVLNERAHGHPVVIIYEDGVWSDPQPMMPQDIVDNYSFVRVAGLKVEDNQLLATGRIGRAGSTGLHPQACDVLFRSKDGEHWTFDRYCYLCEANQRSPLLITNGKAYYPGGATVKHADQPHLIGGDPSGLKWTISDDILNWGYEQPAPGVAGAGNLALADHDGDHSANLKPGYWLWRYAGYNSYSVLLSTEGIDTMQQGYAAGDRSLNLSSRDIAMRLMKDWSCDQDWQWLSQQKHYDDCDLMDQLYAIAAAKITVRSEDDHEETGDVDQEELDEDDGGLVFQVYNKLGIFLTTTPFDTRNFHVKARFQFQHDDSTTDDPLGLGMHMGLTSPREPCIGFGFGVVGCAVDKYNLIAAFMGPCSARNDGSDNAWRKLYLLTREGDEDDNSWTVLAHDTLGIVAQKGEIYEVELVRRGRSLYAQCVRFADGATPTRTQLAEISHDWSQTSKMVPVLDEDVGLDDDRAKVGVICNVQVPETWLERVRSSASFLCRQAGLWDEEGNREAPAIEGDSYEDDYDEWEEGTERDIIVAGERISLSQITQGNKKSKYYQIAHIDETNKIIRGNSSGTNFNWHNDGDSGTWGLAVVNGRGRGFCHRVTNFYYQAGPSSEDEFKVADATLAELQELAVGDSEFHVLPGFCCASRGNAPEAEVYGLGVLARQHDEDRIIIKGVWAYDDERDKSLEWVLKDISAKAGILDWDVEKSIDLTVTPPCTVQPLWLTDIDGADVYQRDFDLIVTLPNVAASPFDSFMLIARATSKLASTPVDGNLTDFAAVKLTYSWNGSYWTVSLHQTSDDADAANRDDWVLIDTFDIQDAAGGKRLRFVGHENFFSVYINDYLLRTFHTGPIYGYDTDGYSESLEGPGYIGIWRGWCAEGATNWNNTTITQPELWAWTDAVILDQRMNAVAGLQRVIRDRRIKFFGTAAGALKISTFDSRDTLPTIGDLLYSDGSSPTDRVPTHIRVVGAEISEYIDHSAAAEYGLLFALAQAESLEEEEAYIEAQRIVDDAVSQAFARQQTAAAQLDWETEDKIPVSYVPFDGGLTVDDDYIVDSVRLSFKPGDMTMQATVRKAKAP